ncbi:cholinesterase-like [Glandiceps talaboti]
MTPQALLLVLCTFITLGFGQEKTISGTTKYGSLLGTRKTFENGKQVDYFLGIPYAEQPLRFQPSSLWTETWNGTKTATSYGDNCWQPKMKLDHPGLSWQHTVENLSEDCLFLNIWTPWPRRNNTAVMVWIHGGSFYWGTANVQEYNGEILASTQNVVVVTINYRLGPLGFLSLGIPEIIGNMGLMDQVVALQWIKDNIANFGGDPDLITLFGCSAGAASVGYHLLAPVSRNLFKRAILQSGTPNIPLLQPLSSYYKNAAFAGYIKSLGCPSIETLAGVLECLLQLPVYNLTNDIWSSVNHFPVVDGTFLQVPVNQILKEQSFKQADVLIGNCENEWMVNLVRSVPGFSIETNSSLNAEEYREAIQFCLGGPWAPDELITDAVCYVYRDWADAENGEKMRDAVDDAIGDCKMKCPVIDFANVYASANNSVYYYALDKRSSASPWPKWMGTVHGDEIAYVFGHPLNSVFSGFSDEDVVLSEMLMKHWTNFAKYGNPNVQNENETVTDEWPRYEPKEKKYVIFDDDFQQNMKTDSYPRTPYCQFWQELVPKLEKLKPVITPAPTVSVTCNNSYELANNYSHELATDYSHESGTDYPHELATGYPHESGTDYLHESATGYPHESGTDYPHELVTGYPHESGTDYPHELATDYPQELATEYPHELVTDYPHELATGYPHESGTDYPHELATDYPHESGTDYPHELVTDYPHELATGYPHESATGYPHELVTEYPGEESIRENNQTEMLSTTCSSPPSSFRISPFLMFMITLFWFGTA